MICTYTKAKDNGELVSTKIDFDSVMYIGGKVFGITPAKAVVNLELLGDCVIENSKTAE